MKTQKEAMLGMLNNYKKAVVTQLLMKQGISTKYLHDVLADSSNETLSNIEALKMRLESVSSHG